MSDFPLLFRVRQTFERPRVADLDGQLRAQLTHLALTDCIRPGQSVAITVGSRGIANISQIIKGVVGYLQEIGGQPFLVPAMGSHGGATAAGQRRLIESYGITEASCGCPIRSSMETVVIGESDLGFPIHFDRTAYEADHVFVCGRVKPHTRFAGAIQSGLVKMLLIGLGKHAGATVFHRAIQDYGFEQVVRETTPEVLRRTPVVAGLAIVENAYEETARIEGIPAHQFIEREPELLRLATRWLPKLPFATADLLLVDEIGKDISGTGLDTNVVGRKSNDHRATGKETPRIRWIAVRGLSVGTHGNATGIGMAEFCLTRAVQAMDRQATQVNCITAAHATAGMLPLQYQTDRDMLAAALSTVGLKQPAQAEIMWIRHTLDLSEVACSATYLPEARDREDLQVLCDPRPLPFRPDGNLPQLAD